MRWLRSDERRKGGVDQRLDAVRIVTPALELNGFVASTGQRVTDILLRGQDLAFLPAGADEAPENWVMVSPSDILVVVPPPMAKSGHRTEQTERVAVSAQLGQYQVTGKAHVRKGEALDDAYRARHTFLPLTDATLAAGDETRRFEVAIVNLAACRSFGPA